MLSPDNAARLGAAAAYYTSSLGIMFVNKFVLSVYGFPSVQALAVCQFAITVVILWIAKALGYISFPDCSVSVLKKIQPLPIFFLLNVLAGLGGTKRINVAMFTVLRRFNIPITLCLNYYILNRSSTTGIKLSVLLMVAGAAVAALGDLSFDTLGFAFIMGNNIFTSLLGITLEKKLDAKELNKWGIMFYNSIISIPILCCLIVGREEEYNRLMNFSGWSSSSFLMCFFLASGMGLILQYSVFLCTQVNSALTTSVVGCLKNVMSAYLSMLGLGGGFVFSWQNFIGINISIIGSLVYAYYEYHRKRPNAAATATAPASPAKSVTSATAPMLPSSSASDASAPDSAPTTPQSTLHMHQSPRPVDTPLTTPRSGPAVHGTPTRRVHAAQG